MKVGVVCDFGKTLEPIPYKIPSFVTTLLKAAEL